GLEPLPRMGREVIRQVIMKIYSPFRLSSRMWAGFSLALLLAVFAAGCKKKAPIAPPPPPAAQPSGPASTAPQKPTITEFTVEPSSIERGQSAVLRWSVSNGTEASIDKGIGTVQSNGTRRVIPSETTTYTLTANGPGGSVTAT